jgi:DNA-directed RNA polymerase subunit RPC12/RpoP
MSKVVKGWKTEYDWDKPTGLKELDNLIDARTSDEGWRCPHCDEKTDPMEEEMNNSNYIELIVGTDDEPMKWHCGNCDKEYFLRARPAIKYETCANKSFGDDDDV